jgi:hypothetical protein
MLAEFDEEQFKNNLERLGSVSFRLMVWRYCNSNLDDA